MDSNFVTSPAFFTKAYSFSIHIYIFSHMIPDTIIREKTEGWQVCKEGES